MTDTKIVGEVPECFKLRGEFMEDRTKEKYDLMLKMLKNAQEAFRACGDYAVPYHIGEEIDEVLRQVEG